VKLPWLKFSFKFLTLYFLGIIALGLGVSLFTRANLGVAPWDTAILNLKRLLDSLDLSITLGQSSLIHTTVLLIAVLLIGKRWESLLAVFPMVAISLAIDVWDIYLLPLLIPSSFNFLISIMVFFTAMILMTWGLATIIISGFPPNVYDDFHLTIIRVFKFRSFTAARWIIEFLGITLGLTYALIQGDGLGGVTFLSIGLAIAFGALINAFVKWYRRHELLNRQL
jgi:uncharacterized membrane protein YczE